MCKYFRRSYGIRVQRISSKIIIIIGNFICQYYYSLWLGSRVVSVQDSGAEGPGSNRSRDAGRSSAGAVQAVRNGPSMSAAQSTTVGLHDGLLHPHLRHCSSPASAVRRLPSAVRTATPAFHVRSSGLFCSRPGSLELVTRLPARSITFL